MKTKLRHIIIMALAASLPLFAQTIAEKKAGVSGGQSELSPEMQKFLVEMNKELKERQMEQRRLQDQALILYRQKAPPEEFERLLLQVNDVKENIRILEESWREMVTKPGLKDEGYALWHQPDSTLEQLIMDYGSLDYVYLIPPEIGQIRVSLSSNILIPYSAWSEMLEQILLQSGVGIKELNPFLRQLYLIKSDLSELRLITNNPSDLEAYPDNTKVSFVLTPEPMDVKRIWYFLEKFVNPNSTVLQRVGRVILIVGDISDVRELLKVYDFVVANKRDLEYKAVPLYRVEAEEMANILRAIFQEFVEQETGEEPRLPPSSPGYQQQQQPTRAPVRQQAPPRGGQTVAAPAPTPKPPSSAQTKRKEGDINALNVIALPKVAQAVFLIGTKEEIKKAEEIIKEVEGQVGAARERSIFWYQVRHSDPEELAQVLHKIYTMMIVNRLTFTEDDETQRRLQDEAQKINNQIDRVQQDLDRERQFRQQQVLNPYGVAPTYYQPPFYQQGNYVVNPNPIQNTPGVQEKPVNQGRDNFIVDPKTGSLVMVVENDILPKLKEVVEKLDQPKMMVQIEVLLFERSQVRDTAYGLNLLKIGSSASGLDRTSLAFAGGIQDCSAFLDTGIPSVCAGITEFFISRAKSSSGIPAFDLAYKFLMSQDNAYLNASPTVVTMNQTPAVIAIQDERSLLVGTTIAAVGTDVLQNQFTRAQYGITIKVTPIIHMAREDDFFDDPTNYVTLISEITFDTFPPGEENSQQPQVNRRQIINQARIPDGQAVIIGGLKRKQTRDGFDKIPFLGEIPGLGKLFSTTGHREEDTEMIIFITPKIISDPKEDFYRLRTEYLCKRPGDLPGFLYRMNEAMEHEKYRLMQGYMTILFGPPPARYICEEGEYDGR